MALVVDAGRADDLVLESLMRLRAQQRAPLAAPAQMSLREYIGQAFTVVEPSTLFKPGWHIDVVAEHLEAVSRGEIRNLVINLPPRHMKSLTVSVFWPTWLRTFAPHLRLLYASYAESLSVRDALKSRRIFQSRWYQERWGRVVRLTGDANLKGRYETDRTGHRIATSVGGSATGEGGDIVVADDVHKVGEAESELEREAVLTWWDETMSSRLNDPNTGSKVIVMQRLHELDLTGHVLDRGGYHHLCLPAEHEPQVTVDMGTCSAGITHEPIRRTAGELLWPAQFNPDALARLKIELGPYAAAGQLQQRPSPRAGMILDPAWFKQIPSLEWATLDIVQFWDLAFSEKQTADWTVGVTLAVEKSDWPRMFIIDVFRQRIDEQRLDVAIANHIGLHRPVLVGIEKRAFEQSGATQDLVRRVQQQLDVVFATWIQPVPADTDKVTRSRVIEGRARAGMIYANLRAPWWHDLSLEMSRFPRGRWDDQVDSLAGAVRLAIEQLAGVRGQKALLGHHSQIEYVDDRKPRSDWETAALAGWR